VKRRDLEPKRKEGGESRQENAQWEKRHRGVADSTLRGSKKGEDGSPFSLSRMENKNPSSSGWQREGSNLHHEGPSQEKMNG